MENVPATNVNVHRRAIQFAGQMESHMQMVARHDARESNRVVFLWTRES